MKEEFTCDDTQEMLDRLAAGTLGEAELGALHTHVRGCPDCSMLLRIHEHCTELTAEDLEAAVPEEMADGMLQSVRKRIVGRKAKPARAADTPAGSYRPRLDRWRRGIVPGLAAAVFVLAFACGYLVSELRQAYRQEERLTAELTASRQALEQYRPRRGGPIHALQTGYSPTLGWRHALPDKVSYSIEELLALLEQLPPNSSILPATGDLTFLERAIPLHGLGYCKRRVEIDMRDGLQAEEAIALAGCLRLDPGARITREELMNFIQRLHKKGVLS